MNRFKLIVVSLLTAWLVCVASPTWAQATPDSVPPCAWWDASAKNVTLTLTPPNIGDVAGMPDASFVQTWFCDTKYSWSSTGFYGFTKNLTADWWDRFKSLKSLSRDDLKTLWLSSIRCPNYMVDGACAEFAPLVSIAKHQISVTRPAPIIWRVRDNPTATTRPVFPVTNGIRSTVATSERVSDSAECKCTELAIEESGGTYCSVSGLQNLTTGATAPITNNRVSLCYRSS